VPANRVAPFDLQLLRFRFRHEQWLCFECYFLRNVSAQFCLRRFVVKPAHEETDGCHWIPFGFVAALECVRKVAEGVGNAPTSAMPILFSRQVQPAFICLPSENDLAARVGLAPTPNGLTDRRATLTLPGNEFGTRGRTLTFIVGVRTTVLFD
jgi:hypothetical protein